MGTSLMWLCKMAAAESVTRPGHLLELDNWQTEDDE